ncbi:DUF2158 domain-containing protein [Rhizobium halophilum]|uniref:DUF2158 domain-containing protein n=1 Tax=Rhizobium halophilum TaxID=2846852 RepID=UPI001EFED163|nr:DUF2158 domain-containing protein [Rhizobium halophilum]MCF6368326.1 DUF2158 domain-containing protein [Rhizobium halophilum]
MATRGKTRAPASTNPAPAPFAPGDIVTLKSGGFPMTVMRMIDTCSEKGGLVELVFCKDSSWCELKRETLPTAVLKPDTGKRDLGGDIPF